MHEKMDSNQPRPPQNQSQAPLMLENQSESDQSKSTPRSRLTRFYNQISSIDVRPNLPLHMSRFMGYRPSNSNLKPIWLLSWLRLLPLPLENLLSGKYTHFNSTSLDHCFENTIMQLTIRVF
jgi:hypothetical protein